MEEKKMCDMPDLATRFLRWFCPDHLFEEIEGDLIEKFNQDLVKLGKTKAKWRFV